MALPNRYLGAGLWLHDLPCWHKATPADVERVRPLIHKAIEPAVEALGAVRITSWGWWASRECTPRMSAGHRAGAIDFVPEQVSVSRFFDWMRVNEKTRPWGKLINERDHIHMTPRGAQGAFGEVWEEIAPGRFMQIEHGGILGPIFSPKPVGELPGKIDPRTRREIKEISPWLLGAGALVWLLGSVKWRGT